MCRAEPVEATFSESEYRWYAFYCIRMTQTNEV